MRRAVITDSNVAKLYGEGIREPLFVFPAGEPSKTRETKEKLEDAMLQAGASRETTVVGFGGGVVCDMAGFIAATFCRGVPLVLVPTTLMAIVDASIGGKNAVNTRHGKNMIGTIYHPEKVVVDLGFLKTLPEKEMRCGLVEMYKHALIADEGLLETMDIQQAIEVKRRILARDVSEMGLRRILNFGHTIGHAIETLSDYQIAHGDAVAIGIVVESHLAYEMGILEEKSLATILKIFGPLKLPFSPDEVMKTLAFDKKATEGVPRFVMLEKIGKPHPFDGEYCTTVPEQLLRRVLHDAAMLSAPALA